MSQTKISKDVRNDYLRFFEERGHEVVPSGSLVPANDPTLLFTNAGMNQFKDVFLGQGDRPYVRAVDTQKCLRVSGKHNDLEEVGHDTYHHTFFEMLGNWSFGDYFKQEAIGWAWELLTEVWGLDGDRLYATVHEGDKLLGLEPDEESARLWESQTEIHPDHILFCDSKDNFWMMGDTGPCGPCSEVHVDLRADEARREQPGEELVNADHPQVIEIWNLVFIQYNAQRDGGLERLSQQHVDTGMGFERILAVLQGKTSTYDSDLFAPLLKKISELTPVDAIRGYDDISTEDPEQLERYRVAMRVVADHVRAIAFAIADGVTPGNTGRDYVIRRIARRAVRYGYQTLELREPFLNQLVEPLRHKMGEAFPELEEQADYIQRVIRAEEENFLRTLGTGLSFFERITPYVKRLAVVEEAGPDGELREVARELGSDRQTRDLLQQAYGDDDVDTILQPLSSAATRQQMPGEVAFLLHDTYGFPIDLTRLMAREEGLGVDMDRYTALMQEQKERARAASTFGAEVAASEGWEQITQGDHSLFTGYDDTATDGARIRQIRTIESEEETRNEVVLDRTPFYAESGGQIGDTGTLTIGDEAIQVLDAQREGERIVHRVERRPTDLDAPVAAAVDANRRQRIKKHHTATHLLHAVLREELGDHVQQKGSLVAPDRLRFDFSHFERVTPEKLKTIERRVNEAIQQNIPKGEERDIPMDEAIERGAMALFGEKYGDRVRVISFDPDFSIELCGGTHVDATGEIGLFRFLSESSVAAGVRRVEAVAGFDALEYIEQRMSELDRVRGRFASLQGPVDEEVAALQKRVERLRQEQERMEQQQLASRLDSFIDQGLSVDGVTLVTGRVDGVEMDALRTLTETLGDRLGEKSVGILAGTDPDGEKVYVVASVAQDLVKAGSLKAGDLVGELGRKLGGGGGGRPNLAAAGGRKPEKLDEVLREVPGLIRERLQ